MQVMDVVGGVLAGEGDGGGRDIGAGDVQGWEGGVEKREEEVKEKEKK